MRFEPFKVNYFYNKHSVYVIQSCVGKHNYIKGLRFKDCEFIRIINK